MSCEKIFAQQLHQHGQRLTAQRESILMALHELAHPASAEEIYNQATAKKANLELTTVYRTLDLLHSLGMVIIIDRGDKQHLYELVENNTPHLHLVCQGCGEITDVELSLFEPLLEKIKRTIHFTSDLSSITIQGMCGNCETMASQPLVSN